MKTLIIAEKPSVARDIVDALPGSFENHDAYYNCSNDDRLEKKRGRSLFFLTATGTSASIRPWLVMRVLPLAV